MKTKGLAIILLLTILMLAAGLAYSGSRPTGYTFGTTIWAHPWDEPNNNNGPSPSSAMIRRDDHRVIMIPISDFLIWIYIKDIPKGSDHQKNSIKINERSYQIIFPW
jgi:hypothetical protein